MTSSALLFLRRLRRPLLVLIAAYAVCTLGFVLIPGVDAEGRPVRMDFLHAFYVVSYTGSTIGFGEIPHAFTPVQRMWMVVTMYVSVVAWLYSIGAIIATLSDPAFRRVLAYRRFAGRVENIGQPFYLVCGYGDTGALVVRELRRYDQAVVVIDCQQERLEELALLDLGMTIPSAALDAANPEHLVAGGLTHRHCLGVLGLTGDDQANLAVAMAARLLNPGIGAICRSHSAETSANMASFGTRHIANPFVAFAERLGLTFRAPSAHVIYECLTTSYRAPTAPPLRLPRGRWIVCGYGRFGQAVLEQLRAEGNEVVVIEVDPERCPPGGVVGPGTEAPTLDKAGVTQAVGIVAGTDHAINNLSIVITAREMQPDIFTIAREVRRSEERLFRNARLGLRVQLAHLSASEAVELLRNPLLPLFLDRLMRSEEGWAATLLARMAERIGEVSPDTWVVSVKPEHAPALAEAVPVTTVPLQLLLRDPRQRERVLPALALMLRRAGEVQLVPPEDTVLRPGDELLLCGRASARRAMHWAQHNEDVLAYLATGVQRPSGWVWRRLQRRAEAGG